MAKKGQAKNTKNKAKHAKLMARKKNKLKLEKELHLKRIKSIIEQQKDKLNKT
ncbi:MAG: hypothetical protein HKP59_01315 [Lutibacter sp.]|uniref:hypothetical protein n=1 Tax=Lutibacter sp. TaxID=1925666 RepID=UPI0017E47AF4|nr:hypothetical protein [Lutibacter sp.]MBT8316243.1 hypothetical protein [Lutibacter sp.]NNJ57103.1 hypothetical protein [Lutibacter sp.]